MMKAKMNSIWQKTIIANWIAGPDQNDGYYLGYSNQKKKKGNLGEREVL